MEDLMSKLFTGSVLAAKLPSARLFPRNPLPAILVAAALGAASFGATPSNASSLVTSATFSNTAQLVSENALVLQVQYRDRRGYRHYHRDRRLVHRHHYRGRPVYRHHGFDPGAAVVAGIFGLAAGAIVAGALTPHPVYPVAPYGVVPHRVYPDRLVARYSASDIAYCSRKYRSFDPVSFTYLGYDGRRHFCRIP
jgi:hypothetical protein